MTHAERQRFERHQRLQHWNAQARQAVRHLWDGDMDAGIQALEALIRQMQAHQATRRGGKA